MNKIYKKIYKPAPKAYHYIMANITAKKFIVKYFDDWGDFSEIRERDENTNI